MGRGTFTSSGPIHSFQQRSMTSAHSTSPYQQRANTTIPARAGTRLARVQNNYRSARAMRASQSLRGR